ncbi:hypothetical protein EVAR_43990_1 [Eumeta japonica]|uniref:Uncharacterized protein n=1 Tax=Eumeta variegata TaxID=151549 RepID=A0A4C1XGV6_EUMVA|nr:hypothetical protein EVAR_43990_1 [Eumeta japonica]
MFSIEWQKRGLPHSHNLIWFQNKIQPNQIDDIIKAEFPNSEEDPDLRGIIVKNAIPRVGELNRNSPCTKDEKCTKRYPKLFLNETVTGEGAENAQEFSEKLLQIGEGIYPIVENNGQIILTNESCNIVETPEQLINELYRSIAENYINSEWVRERIILATKNDIVNGINIIQEMIPREEKICILIDTMTDEQENSPKAAPAVRELRPRRGGPGRKPNLNDVIERRSKNLAARGIEIHGNRFPSRRGSSSCRDEYVMSAAPTFREF